ncbi:2-dehydro-3-deoxygluconokinase [Catalinimonas alkaloidigena]|uniref:2-dehydro-3-deoxygluconokinase n=1 Tax=Catalinimonas alkaloidigena TaxID=1075417 RepID=A0A1G9HUV6_9BACT|nr:sugar kinase [Catalinimonas alkaloidigena]SDL16748.1 2-dehydro-3-deoxygluconokinase [Catalinimonas alkaloidigena]
MPKKIVGFGEIMLRLTPFHLNERLVQTNALQKAYAGAESNVTVALSCLGQDTWFVTTLPDHALGDGAINSLREFGVDTRLARRAGKRIGTYYIEHGAAMRASRIIYDRENSAMALAPPEAYDWYQILQGKDYFHTTGITPALSAACATATTQAIRTAKSLGVQVSFDLNFRRSLWTQDEGRAVLLPLMEHIDVLFANTGSVADVFAIGGDLPADWQGQVEATRAAAEALYRTQPFPLIALTVREHLSASENGWAGLLYDGNRFYESRKYHFHIVDRIGGGDAFTAGVLHGLCRGWDHAKTIEFATAASALKHTIPGDLSLFSENEVLEVAEGDHSGRVKR